MRNRAIGSSRILRAGLISGGEPAAGRSLLSHRRSEFSSHLLMLSCMHGTHRSSRPVPKPSYGTTNCRAASGSLVVDRGLGAIVVSGVLDEFSRSYVLDAVQQASDLTRG